MRHRFNRCTFYNLRSNHPNRIIILFYCTSNLSQFCNNRLNMVSDNIFNQHISFCHRCRNHECTRFNSVWNYCIFDRMKFLNSCDANCVSSCTSYFCPHIIQIIRQINNFRLFRSIFNNCYSRR